MTSQKMFPLLGDNTSIPLISLVFGKLPLLFPSSAKSSMYTQDNSIYTAHSTGLDEYFFYLLSFSRSSCIPQAYGIHHTCAHLQEVNGEFHPQKPSLVFSFSPVSNEHENITVYLLLSPSVPHIPLESPSWGHVLVWLILCHSTVAAEKQ